MNELEKFQNELQEFVTERDWDQFHKPKDLSVSIVLEAAELLEHFLWKTEEEIEEYIKNHKEHIAEEMADVFKYLLNLSHVLDIDIVEVAHKKLKKDRVKHDKDIARGKAPSVY